LTGAPSRATMGSFWQGGRFDRTPQLATPAAAQLANEVERIDSMNNHASSLFRLIQLQHLTAVYLELS